MASNRNDHDSPMRRCELRARCAAGATNNLFIDYISGKSGDREVAGSPFGSPVGADRERLRGADETELLQGGDAVVEADFLDDFSVLELQHGDASEFHLAAGISRQGSHQEVAECGSRMRSAAFPAADDVVTFRDKIRSAPEVQIRERLSEVRHERLDVFPASARFVERIPQEHVGCSEFIDNSEVASLAPEIRKPPANNG